MNQQKFIRLPESELQIMQLVWELEKRKSTDICANTLLGEFSDIIGHLKLTTVLTLITRLIGKGYLTAEKRGRISYYSSVMGAYEYNSLAAANFVATVYHGNTRELIASLCDGGTLSDDDIKKLRIKLDEITEDDGGI